MKKIVYISIIVLFGSCISQEKCLQRFPPEVQTETVTKVEYRDTTIHGGTVEKVITKDSLILLPGEIRTYIDTSGSAELRFYRNQYGDLVAECTAKDKTIEKLSQRITESKTEVIQLPPERFIPWWCKALITVFGILALPTIFKIVNPLIFRI